MNGKHITTGILTGIFLMVLLVSCNNTESAVKQEETDTLQTQYDESLKLIDDLKNELMTFEAKIQVSEEKNLQNLKQIFDLRNELNSSDAKLQDTKEKNLQNTQQILDLKKNYSESLQKVEELELVIENDRADNLSEFVGIVEELEKETIDIADRYDAYDYIRELDDKSFRYGVDGTVYVYNGGEVIYNIWDEPLDLNEFYHSILVKFYKLVDMKKDVIADSDLVEADILVEARGYGFEAVYNDRDERYKSFSRNYVYRRTILEKILEQYVTGISSKEDVETSYAEYQKAKNSLTEYINTTMHGGDF